MLCWIRKDTGLSSEEGARPAGVPPARTGPGASFLAFDPDRVATLRSVP
jgi:hypothetical protein